METNPHILNCFKSLFHPHLFLFFFVIVTFIYPRSADRTPCFFLCNSIHTYGLSVTYIYICDSSTTTMYPDVCLRELEPINVGSNIFSTLATCPLRNEWKTGCRYKKEIQEYQQFCFSKRVKSCFCCDRSDVSPVYIVKQQSYNLTSKEIIFSKKDQS